MKGKQGKGRRGEESTGKGNHTDPFIDCIVKRIFTDPRDEEHK